MLVGGPPGVDIELLERHTVYDGYSASHPVIKRFWRVFASFTEEERSMYVRFAWGRSRLPSGSARWTSKHKLSSRGRDDRKLPVSHTCFFHVELPEYSTDELMRWGLTIAIHYGAGAWWGFVVGGWGGAAGAGGRGHAHVCKCVWGVGGGGAEHDSTLPSYRASTYTRTGP